MFGAGHTYVACGETEDSFRARAIGNALGDGRVSAALAAAAQLGAEPEMSGKKIVVIIPSFAERYLSTALFDGLG